MENKNIDDLLSKYFSGDALPEEAMFLHEWKEQAEDNRLYFENSEKIFFNQKQEIDVQNAWGKVHKQITSSSFSSISAWQIAASVIVLLGVSAAMYFLMYRDNPPVEYISTYTAVQVVLSDGTDITLSPNSTLKLSDDFGNEKRSLYLKGSAYFSVVHREEKPFIVNVEGVFVQDIGTNFFIHTSADTDTVHVRVDEGIVLLFDSLHSEVEIKAGSHAMYVKSIGKIISDEALSGIHVELSFSNLSLAEVVKKLSADYNVKIEIANPALNDCVITSQFKDEKLETILSVITETLNISYKMTETGYLISGEHCNQ